MSAETLALADALAVAFAHGPLAGEASSVAASREGELFDVRLTWRLLGGSVAIEARGASIDACQDKVAELVLRLWPELEEAATWL